MTVMPFIPKDDQELPDNYAMTVFYISGGTDIFELASHRTIDVVKVYCNDGNFQDDRGRFNFSTSYSPFIEYVTKDDVWGWIPMSSVKKIEFDKRFSKMIAVKEKLRSKK